MKIGKCILCDNILKYKRGDRKIKKFCNTQCMQDYKLNERMLLLEQNLLTGNPKTIKRCILKRDGHKCVICNNEKWFGEPIPLIMDHIDGNSENNKSDNLRLVCGNCDMLLPTYKSKNKGNGRAVRRQRYQEGKSY